MISIKKEIEFNYLMRDSLLTLLLNSDYDIFQSYIIITVDCFYFLYLSLTVFCSF